VHVAHSNALRFLTSLFLLFLCSISARAQFQSAFVFAADPNGVAVYTRNDVSGVLTPVAGSPFPSKEAVSSMTLDFKGRYLFTANRTNSKISMFTIDPNTGALQEVPNSLALALVLLKVMKNRCMSDSALRARHLAWSGALTTIFLYSAIYAAGCGGGSTTVTPPPVITPSGTSTITVTPSALSSSGKPLQLQPIQLTLTVK
jgi:Lactonase, 7-bladed beta-propeller